MTKQNKRTARPKSRGKPIQALLTVNKDEEIAGMWATPAIPGIGLYKLLAKRRADGTYEWVHIVQRADNSKDTVFRGTVENQERLAVVMDAINSALRTAYGPLIQLHPGEPEISFVDGMISSRPPDKPL